MGDSTRADDGAAAQRVISREPLRVVRVIGRLNIGGPAQHVVLLNQGLTRLGYETHLVGGALRPGEDSMAYFAEQHGVPPIQIPELVTDTSVGRRDVRAVRALTRVIRDVRPHIVHTHTAKAGFLGRVAARLARTPVLVHTFHGHVLHGYFPAWKSRLLRGIEVGLGLATDQVIAISPGVRDDLLRYRVAPVSKIEVVPLGLDLTPFERAPEHAGTLRRELNLSADAFVMAIVGRIVPIKNHALFLRAARTVVAKHPETVVLVVGDGDQRAATEQLAAQLDLRPQVLFLGWRRDLPAVYADTDLLVVSSNNEGTPVAAIEAMAARCPVVATRVGGVPDLISDRVTGMLVPPGDPERLAQALIYARDHPSETERWARLARTQVIERHSVEGMVSAVDRLYRRLVQSARPSLGHPDRRTA